MVNTSRAHLGACPTGGGQHEASVVLVGGAGSGTSRSHAVFQEQVEASQKMLRNPIGVIPMPTTTCTPRSMRRPKPKGDG